MIITKRVERLYALAQYENVKTIYEIQEEIWNADPVIAYKKLSDMIWEEIKKDAVFITKNRQDVSK